MLFIMPAVTVFIGMSLPGGLTLYWLVITLITAIQQLIVFKKDKNDNQLKDKVIDGEIIK
jgi:membrane protein insertase Oxa1/YidC/SpoIIIJ